MTNSLSELQQEILLLAYQNKTGEGRGLNQATGADAYTWEILAALYGFTPQRETTGRGAVLMVERLPGKYLFSMTGEGQGYRAARAAVSRSLRRLEARGFLVRVHPPGSNLTGVNLTVEGFYMAQGMDNARRAEQALERARNVNRIERAA